MKGHNPDKKMKKKIRVSYFFMMNPYMKFQKIAYTAQKLCHAHKKSVTFLQRGIT